MSARSEPPDPVCRRDVTPGRLCRRRRRRRAVGLVHRRSRRLFHIKRVRGPPGSGTNVTKLFTAVSYEFS
jgi:hypothetical protein